MRPLFRLLLAAVAVLLAAPAAAPAAVQIGIAENQPAMFADPLFRDLDVKRVRVVMSYDVMTSGDDELARVTRYLESARAQGIQPLVTFEHARGDASICDVRRNFRRKVCALPTVRAYTRNLRLFLARFPWVRVLSPWNEINHHTQPTSRDPRRAAAFTDAARRACPRCTLMVADVLDLANRVSARRPVFTRTTTYVTRFRRALKAPLRICGIHNYSDVNRFRDVGTRAVMRALGCRQYWLTETGGLFEFGGSFPPNARRQLRATRYMFRLANRHTAIKRLYVYNWFGRMTPRFDAGLVADGVARPAYREVARRL
jgi:hypothetical protein